MLCAKVRVANTKQRECLASDGALCRPERRYEAFLPVVCYVTQGDPQSGQGKGGERGGLICYGCPFSSVFEFKIWKLILGINIRIMLYMY